MKKKLVLIDSMALIHRAYHAYPALTTSDGTLINAVYGFGIMFLQILKNLNPDLVVFTTDLSEETFRKKLNSEYKANRKTMDEGLSKQIQLVYDFIESTGLPLLKKAGFEADDIIGSVAKSHEKEFFIEIVTGDKDILQLLNENISVVLPGKSFSDMKIYTPKEFITRFGFEPIDYIQYKALVGDQSDNIKGAKGIGEKSATEFIQKYHSIKGIFDHIDKIKERYQKILIEYKEVILDNLELVEIHKTLDFDIDSEKSQITNLDLDSLVKFLDKYEFHSLINNLKKLHLKAGEIEISLDRKEYSLKKVEASKTKKFNNFIFLSGSDPLFQTSSMQKFLYFNDDGEFFESYDLPKKGMGFDIKNVIKLKIKNSGQDSLFQVEDSVKEEDLEDLQILSYCFNPSFKTESISALFKSIYHREVGELFEISVNNKKDENPEYQLIAAFLESKKYILNEIAEKQKDLYEKIDMPLVAILADMEHRGMKVDEKYLKHLETEFNKKILELKQKIYDSVGHEFNPNSTKELSHVLFEELNLPKVKKIKTGFSTNERTISKLIGVHPIIELILEYREYAKLQSTYVIGLQKLIHNSRICTDLRQTVVVTGRLSSINPNLQNIPTRSETGEKIRRAFTTDEDATLLSLDYSQIDLRVMAHISGDKGLIEAFTSDKDIHTNTASLMFNIPEKDVTTDQRRVAKMINFGIIYGISGFGLSDRLEGVDPKTATEFIKKYFERYPDVQKYFDNTKIFVEKNGYVETMFGRKRFFNLDAGNYMVKQGMYREAVNMPIQGLTADIMKLAMIAVQKLIVEKYEGKVVMLLQIHDELLFEIKDDKGLIEKFSREAIKTMEDVVELKVPLQVHAKVGKNWGEMDGIKTTRS